MTRIQKVVKYFISLTIPILLIFINIASSTNLTNYKTTTNYDEREYWALVVTIVDFEYNVNDLNLPVDMMYKPLISAPNWKEDHVLFINNENATKENILEAFDWLSSKTDENDIALFYYGGHGLRRDDTDGDESDGKDEGIATYERGGYILDDQLKLKFDNISAGGLIILIDCCLSAGVVDNSTMQKSMKSNKKAYFSDDIKEDINGHGRVVIASTFEKAIAQEVIGVGTLLTLSLERIISKSQGDKNHDGIISIEETYNELKKIFRRINLFVGTGIASLVYLIKLKFGKEVAKIILGAGIASILLWETFSYVVYGGIMIPYYPLIYDGYEGELPFLEIAR